MKEYTVDIGGLTHTLQLTEDEAKARGLVAPTTKQATPANKQATPANKQATPKNKGNADIRVR